MSKEKLPANECNTPNKTRGCPFEAAVVVITTTTTTTTITLSAY
jgi:hypothetical protein